MIDKSSQFFAILTAVGEAKHANAIAMGLDWMFTEMGLGDANGTDPIPDRLQTQLINEWRRAPLNQIRVDPANPNTVITEQIIPPEVGGEWIREIGLYDVDGDLVAVANCAPSYKPLLDQGSGKTQVVRMNFIVSSSANIVLKIDPAVVLATREYVDLKIQEELAKLDHKQSARVAATAAITLSNLQTVDDVAVATGDRVLVTAQALAQDNGIYVASAEGWTRAADADNSLEVTPGLFIHVEQGTVNGDSLWQLITDAPITLGTTGLQFELIAGGSGEGVGTFRSVTVDALGRVIAGTNPTTLDGYGITDALAVDENLADLTNPAEARDNLGLGTAATADVQADLEDTTVNALMKVGAFGLGGAGISLVAGTDLNTIRTAGFYRLEGTPVNGPSGGTNSVLIVGVGRDVALQLVVQYNTGVLFTRGGGGSGSTWSAWKTQWDSGSLIKQSGTTDATAGRVLLNGAFGMGGKAPNLPGDDFNAAQVGGIYTYESDSLNRPNVANGTSHGLVIHMERSYGNLAYQEVHAANSATYYRYRTGDFATGTWGDWQYQWDSSNLAKQNSASDDALGKVLLTGAYGLGQGGMVLPDGTDLNSATAVGIYRVNTGPNVPTGGEYAPMLVMVAQDVVTQMIIANPSGTIFTRGRIVGGADWSPWVSTQAALGYRPVQEGGGIGQLTNKVYIGWSDEGLKVTVDSSDQGVVAFTHAETFTGGMSVVGDTNVNGSIVAQGNSSANLGVYSGGNVYAGSGAAMLGNDGNCYGTVWEGWLSTYLANNFPTYWNLMPWMGNNPTGGVGTYGLFKVNGGGAGVPGTVIAGSSLTWSDGGATSNHGSPAGTWKLMGGVNNTDGATSDSVTICMRIG